MASLTKLVIVTAITTVSTASYAGDSAWLLCKGDHLVASLLEHRSASGDARDLSVTLISGDHVGCGTISGATGDFQAQPVALEIKVVTGKQPVVFTGTGQLSSDMKTFKLAGKLDSYFGDDVKPAMAKLGAKLTCEVVR